MGIENDEEGEPQRIAENALSAENCGNLIVHVLDALVHGLAHGHNSIVLGVQNGLDIRCVLGVGHFHIKLLYKKFLIYEIQYKKTIFYIKN